MKFFLKISLNRKLLDIHVLSHFVEKWNISFCSFSSYLYMPTLSFLHIFLKTPFFWFLLRVLNVWKSNSSYCKNAENQLFSNPDEICKPHIIGQFHSDRTFIDKLEEKGIKSSALRIFLFVSFIYDHSHVLMTLCSANITDPNISTGQIVLSQTWNVNFFLDCLSQESRKIFSETPGKAIVVIHLWLVCVFCLSLDLCPC